MQAPLLKWSRFLSYLGPLFRASFRNGSPVNASSSTGPISSLFHARSSSGVLLHKFRQVAPFLHRLIPRVPFSSAYSVQTAVFFLALPFSCSLVSLLRGPCGALIFVFLRIVQALSWTFFSCSLRLCAFDFSTFSWGNPTGNPFLFRSERWRAVFTFFILVSSVLPAVGADTGFAAFRSDIFHRVTLSSCSFSFTRFFDCQIACDAFSLSHQAGPGGRRDSSFPLPPFSPLVH